MVFIIGNHLPDCSGHGEPGLAVLMAAAVPVEQDEGVSPFEKRPQELVGRIVERPYRLQGLTEFRFADGQPRTPAANRSLILTPDFHSLNIGCRLLGMIEVPFSSF